MQDNDPSHSLHKTTEFLRELYFCGPQKMNYSTNSLDLNPIKTCVAFWHDEFTRIEAILKTKRTYGGQ